MAWSTKSGNTTKDEREALRSGRAQLIQSMREVGLSVERSTTSAPGRDRTVLLKVRLCSTPRLRASCSARE